MFLVLCGLEDISTACTSSLSLICYHGLIRFVCLGSRSLPWFSTVKKGREGWGGDRKKKQHIYQHCLGQKIHIVNWGTKDTWGWMGPGLAEASHFTDEKAKNWESPLSRGKPQTIILQRVVLYFILFSSLSFPLIGLREIIFSPLRWYHVGEAFLIIQRKLTGSQWLHCDKSEDPGQSRTWDLPTLQRVTNGMLPYLVIVARWWGGAERARGRC